MKARRLAARPGEPYRGRERFTCRYGQNQVGCEPFGFEAFVCSTVFALIRAEFGQKVIGSQQPLRGLKPEQGLEQENATDSDNSSGFRRIAW